MDRFNRDDYIFCFILLTHSEGLEVSFSEDNTVTALVKTIKLSIFTGQFINLSHLCYIVSTTAREIKVPHTLSNSYVWNVLLTNYKTEDTTATFVFWLWAEIDYITSVLRPVRTLAQSHAQFARMTYVATPNA